MRKIDIYFSPLDCLFSLHWGKIGLLGAIKTIWYLVTIPEVSQGLLTKKHAWNFFFKHLQVCNFLYNYLFPCLKKWSEFLDPIDIKEKTGEMLSLCRHIQRKTYKGYVGGETIKWMNYLPILEKETAIHSSIPSWKIPWTEKQLGDWTTI